ncbi:MAG: hypothetical protein ACOZAA_11620 [Pseudomonadota bacterium]
MIGLDFPKNAENSFARWSWRTLAAAIAVTAVAIASSNIFIMESRWMQLSGVQKNPQPKPERVILRWRDRQDPRGFTTPAETNLEDNQFGLAWISGSSISVRAKKKRHQFMGRKSYELTDVFAAETRRLNGQKFWVHEYLIQGARTGDIRRAVAHASNDPLVDAIIVSLNPVWLYNDWAIYTDSNQRASITGMKGATAEDWLYALKYSRPSSILGAVLADASVLVRDRQALGRKLPKYDDLSFPLTKAPEKSGAHYPTAPSFYRGRDFTAPPVMKAHEKYRATLLRQTLKESGQNARFFCLALKSLKAAGKPALLYVAPLPQGAADDKELAAFMGDWSVLTQHLVNKCGGSNIHLHVETWRGVPGNRVHRDIVHLSYGQSVVDAVSRMLVDDLGLNVEKRNGVVLYGKKSEQKRKSDE